MPMTPMRRVLVIYAPANSRSVSIFEVDRPPSITVNFGLLNLFTSLKSLIHPVCRSDLQTRSIEAESAAGCFNIAEKNSNFSNDFTFLLQDGQGVRMSGVV